MYVLLGRRRRRLLLVQLLNLGEERAHLGGLAALARDRADVALAVDQELGVGRAGEEAVRRDDLGGAVGDHREQDARLGPETLQGVGRGVGRRSEERRVGKECRSRWWR